MKSLLQLTDNCCRWPVGDPRHKDFHFCGGPRSDGSPYCEKHSSVAFVTPADNKNMFDYAA